jgi:hypothetical protein
MNTSTSGEMPGSLNNVPAFHCRQCGITGESNFSWAGECLRCEDDPIGDEPLCLDCPHQDACADYGCGKECGVVDADGNEI